MVWSINKQRFCATLAYTSLMVLLTCTTPTYAKTPEKPLYGNLYKLDVMEIKESMYDEITNLKEKKLNASAKVIGQLYEFLNKNNQDLTEEDFWDLLYDYLEWDLTLKSLKGKYSLDDKVLNIIKTDLLLWQEITSKELEKKAQQLEEEAKIKWIAVDIKKKDAIIEDKEEWLKTSKNIKANLKAMRKKLWD